MNFTRRELKLIEMGLYEGIRSELDFIDCLTTEAFSREDGTVGRRVPYGSKTVIRRTEATIRAWERIAAKIRKILNEQVETNGE